MNLADIRRKAQQQDGTQGSWRETAAVVAGGSHPVAPSEPAVEMVQVPSPERGTAGAPVVAEPFVEPLLECALGEDLREPQEELAESVWGSLEAEESADGGFDAAFMEALPEGAALEDLAEEVLEEEALVEALPEEDTLAEDVPEEEPLTEARLAVEAVREETAPPAPALQAAAVASAPAVADAPVVAHPTVAEVPAVVETPAEVPARTLRTLPHPAVPRVFDPVGAILRGREEAAPREEVAEEAEAENTASVELLCFRVAAEEYAISIMDVKEIIKPRELTEVPRTPPFVGGVLSLRGIIIPVFDLRVRLGLSTGERSPKERIVVVKRERGFCGVLVDQVVQVVRLPVSGFEPPPVVLEGIDRDFVQGIGRVEGRMLILLDMGKVLDVTLC